MSELKRGVRGRLFLSVAAALLLVLAGLGIWYWLGGGYVIGAAVRYLSARPLEELATEVTGKSVQVFALVPQTASDLFGIKPQQTALVGKDRFWVPMEVENRSEQTMYLRLHPPALGPQLLLPDVEYRLGAGRNQTILLPFSREGLEERKRVIVNVSVFIEGKRYQTQIILFDVSPVRDVFEGREPGKLTLQE